MVQGRRRGSMAMHGAEREQVYACVLWCTRRLCVGMCMGCACVEGWLQIGRPYLCSHRVTLLLRLQQGLGGTRQLTIQGRINGSGRYRVHCATGHRIWATRCVMVRQSRRNPALCSECNGMGQGRAGQITDCPSRRIRCNWPFPTPVSVGVAFVDSAAPLSS